MIIHAYYALLLECRDAMTRWGLPPLTRQQVHSQARLRLIYSAAPDLKEIGFKLERLSKHRSAANYDLQSLSLVATADDARDDVQIAQDALALLDVIDADPGRRAAAIAAIKP